MTCNRMTYMNSIEFYFQMQNIGTLSELWQFIDGHLQDRFSHAVNYNKPTSSIRLNHKEELIRAFVQAEMNISSAEVQDFLEGMYMYIS